MKSVKELLRKVKKAFFEEGLKGVVVRTKNYIVFNIGRTKKKEIAKDILFINGCTVPQSERYRVDHQIEQLEANGLTADKVFYEDLTLDVLKLYRGFVFFRCPITPTVEEFIKKAHYYNKKVFFDIDDLVIDRKYTDTIPYVQQMGKEDRELYDSGVDRMGKTMALSDCLITSTTVLKRELLKYNEEVFINKNVASEEMVELSLAAMRKVKKNPSQVVIGYLSGSITHNADFEMIKPALIKLMKERENVRLLLMGHLDLPEDLKEFESRIIKQPFDSWKKLPETIASLDINLAPIEKSIFNEAKSENKWTEAALCRVVTAASDFGAFHEVICDGETGVLCKNREDWYKKLKMLVDDAELRWRMAEKAYKEVMEDYVTVYSGFSLAEYIESKLAPNIGFVLPTTNISGGVNVVLKHGEILRRHGYDVTVISMDKYDDNIMSDDGEVNVISEARREIEMRFDKLVATLYTTLGFVKSYPDVKQRFYLVQNFETDFGKFGSDVKRKANATYNAQDTVEYITISKWCQNWLKEKYHKNAKLAPNGIDLKQFEVKEREFAGKIKVLVEGNSDDYYKNVDESFKIAAELDPNKYEIMYLSYQGKPKKWHKVDRFYHKIPHGEVAKVYEGADILLKSSLLESFSYPPLEMMATGGYVVVAPNAGNVEYLKDGENCLFYELGNAEDGVHKIEEIVENKKMREKLARCGEKTAKERDWSKIERKVLELYD